MKEREIYLLFTDTGTWLSKAINFFTRKRLNHVSIAFREDLETVYSFGRKQPKNPFIGGFVIEDVKAEIFVNSECAIYRHQISAVDYRRMIAKVKEVEANKHEYRYNFIGLFGVLLHIQIHRKSAFFCSQFVAKVLEESDCYSINKPICFITPADIRSLEGLELVYRGKIGDYHPCEGQFILGERITPKQSFLYNLSNKLKLKRS